jgi:hypothetical protein
MFIRLGSSYWCHMFVWMTWIVIYKRRQWQWISDISQMLFCFGLCDGHDRVCGLLVRLPCCRPIGPGFDFKRCEIFCIALGLERCPLSPCEDKWGATWKKSSGSGLENLDSRPWGFRRADHATPLYPQKVGTKFQFPCGLKAMELLFIWWANKYNIREDGILKRVLPGQAHLSWMFQNIFS